MGDNKSTWKKYLYKKKKNDNKKLTIKVKFFFKSHHEGHNTFVLFLPQIHKLNLVIMKKHQINTN